MGVVVAFDFPSWQATFPQFGTLTQDQVVNFVLPLAEQYVRNDGGGPVTTVATQSNLINLMVAHLCTLFYGENGQSPSGIVGRINSASEGSVSVSAEFPMTANNAWFMQTPFGAAFWQACAPYRTMRYMPGPRRNFNPWPNQ